MEKFLRKAGPGILVLAILVLAGNPAEARNKVRSKIRGKARFKHADKNQDGKVGVREYRQERHWENRQKSRVNRPWEEKADKNDDSYVSRVEKDKAHANQYLKKRSEVDKPWEEKADTDNDGIVEKDELKDHTTSVADKNDDGKVDRKEYRQAHIYQKRKVNTEAEKKFDTDGDGYINKEEAKEMFKARLGQINRRKSFRPGKRRFLKD